MIPQGMFSTPIGDGNRVSARIMRNLKKSFPH